MDEADKERNREIAQNEAERQITGDIRVSAWTIVFTIIAGVIVFAIVWLWLNR
jgi:Flp pilus assembly protein TadB